MMPTAPAQRKPTNRTLFVAIKMYDEYELLSAWRQTFGSQLVQYHDEIEFRFFTYNKKLATNSTSADVIYLPDAIDIGSDLPGPGETQLTSPTFWRDFRVGMYRWALDHVNFKYWLEIEIDSVPCWETLVQALHSAPSEDFTLGFNWGCCGKEDFYDDSILIATRGILQGISERWGTYRQRLIAEQGNRKSHGPNMNPRIPQIIHWLYEDNVVVGHALISNFLWCPKLAAGVPQLHWLAGEPWQPIVHDNPLSALSRNYYSFITFSWNLNPFMSSTCDMCFNRFSIHAIKDPRGFLDAWNYKVDRASTCDQDPPQWAEFWRLVFSDPIQVGVDSSSSVVQLVPTCIYDA